MSEIHQGQVQSPALKKERPVSCTSTTREIIDSCAEKDMVVTVYHKMNISQWCVLVGKKSVMHCVQFRDPYFKKGMDRLEEVQQRGE